MRVEFVGACRQYASELAVNEVTTRAHSELTLQLETGTKVLLDSLRHAGDGDRPFRQSQVDAAIRFCRTVFGSEYASLLAKAAEVAVQTGREPRGSRWLRARRNRGGVRNCRAAVPIAAAFAPCCNRAEYRRFPACKIAVKARSGG